MARSVADATRFTQTAPHAARPSHASTLQFSEAPPNETPQQKIRRLREASRAAKLNNVNKWDRIVERGRVWADRSHRAFSLTLIGFTGLTLIYCSAATIDMLSYNRRKRNAFNEQQQLERIEYIKLARDAEATGTATEKQLDLLNIEREREQERALKEEQKFSRRIKNAVFGGFSTEETRGGTLAAALERTAQPESTMGGTAQKTGEGLGIMKAVEESNARAQQTSPSTHVGGQLDRLGDNASKAVSQTTKSWTSWMTGR